MSAPLIWAGNFAKFLKSQLNLGDQVYILNGSTDPTVVATLAPAGSIYMLNVAGSANVYLKNDAGSTTNWTLLASGISITAVEIDTAMRDEFDSSVYQFMNKNIIGFQFGNQIQATTGTAAYDSVNKQINFGSVTGSVVFSKQQLDPVEFLGQSSTITDITQVDLTVFWAPGSVDTGATYQVSRDGGTNFQNVTMQNAGIATEVYGGTLSFTVEPSNVTLFTNAGGATQFSLNSTPGVQGLAQILTVASGTGAVVRSLTFNIAAQTGTPVGNLLFKVVKDSSGTPSLLTSDVLSTTTVGVSTLAVGNNTISLTNTILPAGTYWLTISYDSVYGGASVANYYNILANNSVAGSSVSYLNGGAWFLDANYAFGNVTIAGRPLDLRVRITSSVANSKLNGWAISYRQTSGTVVTSTNKQQSFSFISTAGDPTLTLTAFTPDPSLMRVYHVQTGLTYMYGVWSLQGTSIVFPSGFFNPDGISRTVSLVADQNTGGSFDNSDVNALLLAANSLGSTNPSIDKSGTGGKGPILRRPDGTLRMLALDNLDNLTISSVP